MSGNAGSSLTKAMPPGWSKEGSPYHAGEQAAQERTGQRARMELVGRKVIREEMPDQHRLFFTELPSLIVGGLDGSGRTWASILFGRPGFIASPDPRRLEIAARPVHGDPLAGVFPVGAPLGLLGLQFETRRRNRMNGNVRAVAGDGFSVDVGQSFGNCAKYIQARESEFVSDPADVTRAGPIDQEGPLLSESALRLVAQADTFFIATASPRAQSKPDAVDGVDVSHRGGNPGFVRITNEDGHTVLTVPDFLGNSFFNTLGNLLLNPSAGLLFIDFVSGDLLWLTGHGEVVWGMDDIDYVGAERFFRFRVEKGYRRKEASPLRWSEPKFGPHLAATGPWSEVA